MSTTTVKHRVTLVVEKDHTITVPTVPFEVGQSVEVIIHQLPTVNTPPRFPLRGTPVVYQRPFEPVADDDWHGPNSCCQCGVEGC